MSHGVVYVRAAVPRQQEGGSGAYRHVLNVNVHPIVLAKALEQFARVARRLQRVDQLHLAAREVVVLEVNQQECGLHLTSLHRPCLPVAKSTKLARPLRVP
jgi:hypothetical protein